MNEVKPLDVDGSVDMKGTKRQERFAKASGYRQKGHPFKVTSCGRRRPMMYNQVRDKAFQDERIDR